MFQIVVCCLSFAALKKEFQNPNDDIDKLSKHFVLVNLEVRDVVCCQ